MKHSALPEPEDLYRTLFVHNHSPMLVIDPESAGIVDANPAACTFYGYSREELTALRTTDVNLLTEEEVVRETQRAWLGEEQRNGREALASRELERGPLHLLLTDVIMPLMGGPELARMLLPAHPRMKILYMSGYTDDAIIHHGVLDRTVHLVEKPFARRELLQRVRRILDQPDSVSPDRRPPQ